MVLNSLPKSALAPLFIVWLGTGINTIIVAGISVAVFGSVINLYTGFRQVDEEKIKLIYTLGGSKRDAFCKVVLPGSVPTLLSNMKVNIGLALVGVIIGEFLAARRGLGYLIIYGSQVFRWWAGMIGMDIRIFQPLQTKSALPICTFLPQKANPYFLIRSLEKPFATRDAS